MKSCIEVMTYDAIDANSQQLNSIQFKRYLLSLAIVICWPNAVMPVCRLRRLSNIKTKLAQQIVPYISPCWKQKIISRQTRDVEPMLGWCWADVVDDRPTLYISFHLSPPMKSNPRSQNVVNLFMINYWNQSSGKGVSLKCASLSGLFHSYFKLKITGKW